MTTLNISIDECVGVTASDANLLINLVLQQPSQGQEQIASVDLSADVPDSFWQGLLDCEQGRHFDMGKTLEDPPPSL